jgi:hypothetical protein
MLLAVAAVAARASTRTQELLQSHLQLRSHALVEREEHERRRIFLQAGAGFGDISSVVCSYDLHP